MMGGGKTSNADLLCFEEETASKEKNGKKGNKKPTPVQSMMPAKIRCPDKGAIRNQSNMAKGDAERPSQSGKARGNGDICAKGWAWKYAAMSDCRS